MFQTKEQDKNSKKKKNNETEIYMIISWLWDGQIILNFPSKSDVLDRGDKRGRVRETLEDAMLLTLKMEEEPMSQGMQPPSK